MKHAITIGIVVGVVFSFAIAMLWAQAAVTLKVDPRIVGLGGNTWVTCRVPKHPDNRKLTLGIRNHRLSDYQLNGLKAPSMHTLLVSEIPCMPEVVAICRLETNSGEHMIDTMPVTVAGCR